MFRRSPSRSPSGSRSPCRSPSSSPCRSPSRYPSSSPCRPLSLSPCRSPSRSPSSSPCRPLSLSPCRSPSRSRSRWRVDHPNSESRAAIERKFGELQRRHDKLIKANTKITEKVNMLGDKIEHILKEFKRADSLPTAVLHFVHQLEKATMYFQFKRKARQRHKFEHYTNLLDFAAMMRSPRTFAAILRRDEELMLDFSNIGDSDIDCAATAICWERTQTSRNEPVLMDWIYRRVCHVLQGDYVMDKDPEVELKKMMESDPDKYDRYFLQRPANYKKMSKQEAYKKYSELVSIINTVSKEALEEKRKSRLATNARNKEAVYAKRKKRKV